jgi:apolipoprotein N-acyltransferase
MTAKSDLYTRGVIIGPTFTVTEQTPYTQWGDWFGILVSVLFGAVSILSIIPARRKKGTFFY